MVGNFLDVITSIFLINQKTTYWSGKTPVRDNAFITYTLFHFIDGSAFTYNSELNIKSQ
jgi:hypothetical protein